jgi:hypothetical protein
MCLRRAPEKYIAGAALDRAALHFLYIYYLFNVRFDSELRKWWLVENKLERMTMEVVEA